MIAWFTKDDYGNEYVFLNEPILEEDEECINPYAEYPEPFEYRKTGKHIWTGDLLFPPEDEHKFNLLLEFPKIERGQKVKIEITIKKIE